MRFSSTAGDTHLGGDDFDQRIIDWMVSEFKKSNGIDLSRATSMAMQRLKEAAEKAKIELSGMSHDLHQPAVSSPRTLPARSTSRLTLTRAKFNELTADLVERTMGPVRQALSDAGLSASDQVDKVLLVGGSTRIPAVQEAVKSITGKDALQGHQPGRVRRDRRMPFRAAFSAARSRIVLLLDVTPLSLGIETLGGVFN